MLITHSELGKQLIRRNGGSQEGRMLESSPSNDFALKRELSLPLSSTLGGL